MNLVPKCFFLTRGKGTAKDKLHSFELALRDAGISPYNLVKVSSIIPPGCRQISKEEGLKKLSPGGIVFCVLSENFTNEKSRIIGSSVGIALPADPLQVGYISEHHSTGESEIECGIHAEYLAAIMLITLMGKDVEHHEIFERRRKKKDHYKLEVGHLQEVEKTMHICQVMDGCDNSRWCSTVAAAVLVL